MKIEFFRYRYLLRISELLFLATTCSATTTTCSCLSLCLTSASTAAIAASACSATTSTATTLEVWVRNNKSRPLKTFNIVNIRSFYKFETCRIYYCLDCWINNYIIRLRFFYKTKTYSNPPPGPSFIETLR